MTLVEGAVVDTCYMHAYRKYGSYCIVLLIDPQRVVFALLVAEINQSND